MVVSKKERLQAAISGERTDRPPVALWRHFPVDDQDPANLAQAILEFQSLFDFDFIKVTPASSFCIRDWGSEDEWRGNPEGTREYHKRPVHKLEDWLSLRELDPNMGSLGDQLKCLETLQASVSPDTPMIQTIFSPLSQAKNLCGSGNLLTWLHKDPQTVFKALEVITRTTIAFIERARDYGIAGIFYAVQHASYRFFDYEGYARFGEPYDRRILNVVRDLWLNVLHLHGTDLIFDFAPRFDVQVVNWHDRETGPSLAEARQMLDVAVCGGLSRWDSMVLGDPEKVDREAQIAIRSLDGGIGLILGTGCVVPILAPRANLVAARNAVETT
jgi:uroporphyrinogen decarboxylase